MGRTGLWLPGSPVLCPGAHGAVRADTNLLSPAVRCHAWFCLVPCGVSVPCPVLGRSALHSLVPGVLALLSILPPAGSKASGCVGTKPASRVLRPEQPPQPQRVAGSCLGQRSLQRVSPCPVAQGTIPACAARCVLCLLRVLLPRAQTVRSAVWTGTWAHLTGTWQIKSLPLVFDLLLCDKAARMSLHPAEFPGGMWAGNCIIAAEGSCVTLLAADDAVAHMHDTKGTCMSLPVGPMYPFQSSMKAGGAVLPVSLQPAEVTA